MASWLEQPWTSYRHLEEKIFIANVIKVFKFVAFLSGAVGWGLHTRQEFARKNIVGCHDLIKDIWMVIILAMILSKIVSLFLPS